jgi:hypothetical protein
VNDLDDASDFYREVMGCIEMQSHNNLINRGLATYYGFEEIWDRLEVSLRFLVIPDVVTIKLVKMDVKGYGGRSGMLPPKISPVELYSSAGAGPISLVVDDLDKAYAYFSAYASDYNSRHKISILSEPVFLSPLLPHQIGATTHSALFGNAQVLSDLKKKWPLRAKFQVVDPFGMRWEFNNPIDGQ